MSISNEKTVWCDDCGDFIQVAEGDHGNTDQGARDAAHEQEDYIHLLSTGEDLCPTCFDKRRWDGRGALRSEGG